MAALEDKIIPILPRCANLSNFSIEAVWYYPSIASEFLICSYCYAHYIESTEHATDFEAAWGDADSSRKCQWNTPRVMSYFETGNWDSIKRYMVRRSQLPACEGASGHTDPDGSRWYTLRSESVISTMAICELCYEELIVWNDLKKYFTTLPSTKSTEATCTCNAVPFIRDAFKIYAASTRLDDEWNDFLPWAKRRMELPSCKEMKQLEAGRTDWYASKTVPKLLVCGACYLDTFGLDYGNHWDSLSLTSEQNQLRLECVMSTMPIKIAWACFHERETHDYEDFENHAKIILESPRCDSEGISHVIWYTPQTYLGNQFAICGRCVAAFMIPPGFRSQFREISSAEDGSAYICDFNPLKPRFLTYMAKYDEAVAQEDLEVLSGFVSWYAALPDCPRNVACSNRKWYGTKDFTVCELCYEEIVKKTSLASSLEFGTIAGEEQCHLYSPRMRKLWMLACEENDLESFGAVARQRMEVLTHAQNGIFKIRLRQQTQQNQQASLFMSSIRNQGIEGMVNAMGQHRSYEYGNSEVGWGYTTLSGAEGAMQIRQALAMNPFQPEDAMQIARFNAMWAEVE